MSHIPGILTAHFLTFDLQRPKPRQRPVGSAEPVNEVFNAPRSHQIGSGVQRRLLIVRPVPVLVLQGDAPSFGRLFWTVCVVF